MPAIKKGDLVLVTGASGFIAAHTVRTFLKEGFRVRGTVRSTSKGDYLKKLFAGDGDFDYVIAGDITDVCDDFTLEGVFDKAVEGVDAVAHLASPFYVTNVQDPQELIGPAVKGTEGILRSIQRHGPGVKRVVVTSSTAAVRSDFTHPAPYRYTEADWNQDAPKHVEENGLKSKGLLSYQASKTLAEKALWAFVDKEKPTWDAATINPPMVFGPVIHECPSPDKLNTSVAGFYAWASGKNSEDQLPGAVASFVNVSDVALAHVRALTVPEAGGNRFICSPGQYVPQDFCDILHKRFPELQNVPVGKPNTHDEACKDSWEFNGAKAREVLGIKYKELEDTVVEMTKDLQAKKWL